MSALCLNADGQVLLLRQRFQRPNRAWGFPGGLVELGEDVQTAVAREVREETGITLDASEVLMVENTGGYIEVIFIAPVGDPPIHVQVEEVLEWSWVDVAHVNLPMRPGHVRALDKLRSRRQADTLAYEP